MLRLRRSRGYAQHERTLLRVVCPTPFALSVAERSRRAQSAGTRANFMPLAVGGAQPASGLLFSLCRRSSELETLLPFFSLASFYWLLALAAARCRAIGADSDFFGTGGWAAFGRARSVLTSYCS